MNLIRMVNTIVIDLRMYELLKYLKQVIFNVVRIFLCVDFQIFKSDFETIGWLQLFAY